MSKLADIGKNAIEDGAEDFISAYIYRRSQKLVTHFTKDFESGSEFDDAIQSTISTLIQGGAVYLYTGLTNLILVRGAKITMAFWTYIVAGAMKKKILDKLKASKLKGNKAIKALSLITGADRTSDRIAVTQLIQSNIDSYDKHKFHIQNTYSKNESKIDNFSNSMTNLKNTADNSILIRFNQKTSMGSWENTALDKRLYEKAIGVKLSDTGALSWSVMYLKLNKFTEFYKTLDGDVTNLSTSLQMNLSRSGLVR